MGQEKGSPRQIWFGKADTSLDGVDRMETGKHANQLARMRSKADDTQ